MKAYSILIRKMIFSLFVLCIAFSCKNENSKRTESMQEGVDNEQNAQTSKPFIVTTSAMEFNLPKDTLNAGWNTIEYRNNSNETHFLLLEKYPEGKTLADTEKEIGPPFQKGMDLVTEGKMDDAMAAFGELPEWFQKVEFYGGVGLISPRTSSTVTVALDPGYYVMECYVKMPDGRFHSMEGMVEDIVVVEEKNSMAEPEADYTIKIGTEGGISLDQTPEAGRHMFRVEFTDQKAHENFMQHDVHLVRMQPGADVNILAEWMNWLDPEGFKTPAPEGFKFLGGMQELSAGRYGFFEAELQKGNYMLIAEVPGQKDKEMLQEFEVN